MFRNGNSESQGDKKPGTFRKAFKGKVNTPHKDIYRNLRTNIRRQLPQVQAYPPNDYKVALLLGGPSLKDAKIPRGWKVATVNATHGWALERGLKPSVHMMLDARPFNARFLVNPVDTCRYLLNAQMDPACFDALEGYDVHIWFGVHRTQKVPDRQILDRYYRGRWQNVFGGSTIGTRAFGLLYLLGIRTLRVYGMDSCLVKNEHHAYDQPENDDRLVDIRVGRRRFKSHTWMVAQIDEFLEMAPHIPDDLRFGIEGDGVIAHIVNETRRLGRVPKIVM